MDTLHQHSRFAAPISEQIWDMKYRLKKADGTILDHTVEGTWSRIAYALSSCEKDQALWAEKFYGILEDFVFLPAGRIIAGAGTGRRVTLSNCFTMGTIPDDLAGIYESLKEAALTMQQGGGIGYDFSTIRPKGALVRGVDSDASGPLSFMDCWDTMCRTIMSAGSRRGAMMATMRCDHPDIEDFITAKHDPAKLRMFNMSVLITDAFMEAVHNGTSIDLTFNGVVYKTVQARDLWGKIMLSTYDYAEPGVIFIDRVNRDHNLNYLETVATTNPCFTGDTSVWTSEGPRMFMELASTGDSVEVLSQDDDGNLVFRTMHNPRMTQESATIYTVAFDNGTFVNCTGNHEFFLPGGGKCAAQDLQPGQSIASVYRRRANSRDYQRLVNTEGDSPLEHHVPFREVHGTALGSTLHVHHLNKQRDDNRTSNLEVMDASEHNSMHMLGNLNPSRRFPERNALIQQDHSGENNGRYLKHIDTVLLEEMRAAGLGYTAIARKVGMSKYGVMKRLGYVAPNHKVVSVTKTEREEPVYCGTVEGTSRFFVDLGQNDGVLVSNCGEKPMGPYASCLLGSINLARLVRDPFTPKARFDHGSLERTVGIAIRMMDNVVDVGGFPLEAQLQKAKQDRQLGLGITGLADALLMLGIRYGSEKGARLATEIMRIIDEKAYLTSIGLAEEKGPFPTFDAKQLLKDGTHASRLPRYIKNEIRTHGLRNALLTSIAPTGTISLYAGNVSSGIEPIFAPAYTRKVLQKNGSRTEERVVDYAIKLWEDMHPGEDSMPPELVTAQDLSPEDHIRMQAAVQPHVDSSISKTVNLPADITIADFKDVYTQAYKSGCKGCTTYRPNAVTGSVLSVDEKPQEAQTQTPAPQISQNQDTILERPKSLPGETYKLKWADSPHAFYITISDIVTEDGITRPFEIFINSKSMEHYQWIVGLTRMISAVFRRGGDVSFVAEELKAVFDPRGGAWQNGQYVPSLLAAIGGVIEQHLADAFAHDVEITDAELASVAEWERTSGPRPQACKSCGGFNVVNEAGCSVCKDCGHSACS